MPEDRPPRRLAPKREAIEAAVVAGRTPKIVEAPRPEDDSRASWRALIAASLPEHEQRDFERHEFVPCYACSVQPGSPTLCRGCLANRQTITELHEQRKKALQLGARVAELARRAAAAAAHEAAGIESRLLGLIRAIESEV